MTKKIVLEAITGSKAYGLDHAKSDTDKMGIFVAPTVHVAGLGWASKHESWSNAGPDGDDYTLHEIGKYLKLVLKSNPTLVELLFLEDYELLSEEGKAMVDLRDKILYTEGIRSAYYGYAKAQAERVMREYPLHKPKMARHCVRIALQGYELLTTGDTNVKVKDPEYFFGLDRLDQTDLFNTLQDYVDIIDTATSVLRDEPDRKAVAAFLEDVRRNNLG
jgi:predicted nucleotidyltransferase